MRNRDRMDIISQILETANGVSGATKTKIMYNAFLGYSQLKEYLTTLTENHLLHYDFLSRTFKTTEKGLRFLKTYNQIDEMMKAPQF
jgi:predicted transcriptional regulator